MPTKPKPAIGSREAAVAIRAASLTQGEKRLAEIKEQKLPDIQSQLILLGQTDEDEIERSRLNQDKALLLQEAKEIAEIIKGSSNPCLPTNKVVVGATVSFTFIETGVEHTLTLVSSNGSPKITGTLSTVSPVGAALMGARVGDVREATCKRGAVERVRVTEICTD